jgi:GAF domain-containing protein
VTANDHGRQLASIARDLAEQADRQSFAIRLAELAAKISNVAGSTVVHRNRGGLLNIDATAGPQLRDLAAELCAGTDGPLWAAVTGTSAIVLNRLPDERWRGLTSRLTTETDIRSAALFSLGGTERERFALGLFSDEPGYFGADQLEVLSSLVDHASIGLSLVLGRERVANLQVALATNRNIGVAVGIAMSQLRLPQEVALDTLVRISQRSHRKLRDVADEVAFTGEVAV